MDRYFEPCPGFGVTQLAATKGPTCRACGCTLAAPESGFPGDKNNDLEQFLLSFPAARNRHFAHTLVFVRKRNQPYSETDFVPGACRSRSRAHRIRITEYSRADIY